MIPGRVLQKSVLVVDDEPAVRDALKLLLEVDRHAVTEARDGVEAFELLAHGKFDLLITDYEMPRMKGNELAAKVRALSPSLPILMITAYAEQLGNVDHRVDAILSKPFEFEDLRQAIARLLS
jgi:CheY-like chemotaxis protein